VDDGRDFVPRKASDSVSGAPRSPFTKLTPPGNPDHASRMSPGGSLQSKATTGQPARAAASTRAAPTNPASACDEDVHQRASGLEDHERDHRTRALPFRQDDERLMSSSTGRPQSDRQVRKLHQNVGDHADIHAGLAPHARPEAWKPCSDRSSAPASARRRERPA